MWQEGPALFSSFQGQGFHNRPIIRAVEHLGQLLQRHQHHLHRTPSHARGVPSNALGQVVAFVAGAALDIDQVSDQTHLQTGFPRLSDHQPLDNLTKKGESMRTLSKSKLLAYRHCPKRLGLEVHRPKLREDSATTQASFAVGHVGDIARRLYDPKGNGVLIDPQADGFDAAFARTQELLQSACSIFEAGFRADGALALADVMLPVSKNGKLV